MVGTALRAASDELNVPWHRVINSQGKISFPSGGEKAKSQQDILEHEGVVFLSGSVNLNAYAWQGNLDSELWRM